MTKGEKMKKKQKSNEQLIRSVLAKNYRDEISNRIKRGMALAKEKRVSDMNNPNAKVAVKLEKWQIPYLLGAIRLGIFVEHWSASLTYSIGCSDSHSLRWKNIVTDIITTIREQTGIDEEDTEHGLWYVGAIGELVNKVAVSVEMDHNRYEEVELNKCDQIADTVKKCIDLTIPKEKITKEFVDDTVRAVIEFQDDKENEQNK